MSNLKNSNQTHMPPVLAEHCYNILKHPFQAAIRHACTLYITRTPIFYTLDRLKQCYRIID